MKRVLLGIFLLGIFVATSYTYPRVQVLHEPSLRLNRLPPSWILEMMSMGNRELLSTIIFYHTSFYYGEKTAWRKEEAELRRVYDTLEKATDLDPYNMDCYYLAQGTLSWIKPAIPKLNELLEKGHTYRTWDWYLPFFLAANYYFQLDDPVRAAYYLKDASMLKPENQVFSSLTARMFYEGDQTETAIAFLRSMVLDTKSPLLRKKLLKRLRALETIRFLEKALQDYHDKIGHDPDSLDDLIRAGIIRSVPPDPYGGSFYLAEKGRICTTSKLAEGWRKDQP